MTSTFALLILAYIFLAALMLLSLTSGRLHWIFKTLLVIVTSAFYLLSYQGWKQSRGWPTPAELPPNFILHASVIDEPDAETGGEGQIFIWATTLHHGEPQALPRAYRIDYDREVHSSLQDALRNQRNGMVQLGSNKREVTPGEIPKDTNRMGEERNQLEFKNLPDPALPEK